MRMGLWWFAHPSCNSVLAFQAVRPECDSRRLCFTQPGYFPRRHNEELIEKLSVPKKDAQPLHFDSEYPQGYVSQFNQCLWKFWLSYWRDAPCESGTTSCFDVPHGSCSAVNTDMRHSN
jgi:hypothetical protein